MVVFNVLREPMSLLLFMSRYHLVLVYSLFLCFGNHFVMFNPRKGIQAYSKLDSTTHIEV